MFFCAATHCCKTGVPWCKRLLRDHFSSWSKHLLHPLLTTLGNFEVAAPVAGTWGRIFYLCVCAPISCILLVMHHQMFQECCPIVQTPDQSRELTATGSSVALSQPASQGEPWPWPDADPWQGQDSQLSVASTQGVDPLAYFTERMRQ